MNTHPSLIFSGVPNVLLGSAKRIIKKYFKKKSFMKKLIDANTTDSHTTMYYFLIVEIYHKTT